MATLLAGLGAYVYFVELPAERTQAEKDTQEKKILPFEQRHITELRLKSEAGEIALASKNGTWSITAPLEAEADSRTVENMIRTLVLGKVNRVIEGDASAATLASFGLDKPSTVLTITADSRQEILSLGDTGPISSSLYAMRASDRRVLLTDLAAKDFLNKSVFAFRRKDILRVNQTQMERVRLTYPKTEIVLSRNGGQNKGKSKWTIRYPIEAPADQPEVRTLLMKLEDMKALGFIDPGPEHDMLLKRLKSPEVKVTLHTDGADQTVKLFRGDAASGEAYAVTAAEAPIYRVTPALLQDLSKDLFALQDKRLLGLESEDIVRLMVKRRDETYTLIRQNNAWVLEEQPEQKIDQEKAALLVSRVASLPAELRVVKRTGPLTPYGLSAPVLEFTASAKDGKESARLALGSQAGGLIYAMGKALPGIYQARADLLTQTPPKHDLLTRSGGGS
jgi:hypothetical protein